MQLKADVNDDQNWISSGELNRILASTDFQECPRTYFIVSNVPLPSHLLTLGSKWLHIYYVDNEHDFDQVRTQFRHELAQHYRQTAQRVRREQDDRVGAKRLLAKSSRLYELLEQDAEERMKRFANMPSS
jgi:hypothetical protein